MQRNNEIPLSSGFMAVSMIGFFVSVIFVKDLTAPDPTWPTTLGVFFFLMFVFGMISMTRAMPIPEHIENLDIADKINKRPVKKIRPVHATKKVVKKATKKVRKK